MIHFSVIDFHGLEDKVIPYDITSAKGIHNCNRQNLNEEDSLK